VFALECWANTHADTPDRDDGLAVGEMWYSPDRANPMNGHAICPAITDKGLVFLEPQNGKLCDISADQLASLYFLRF